MNNATFAHSFVLYIHIRDFCFVAFTPVFIDRFSSLCLPSRCTVVLYNPRKNRQTHITNSSRKTITCLGFSVDGRHLVTGECGHLPSVRVWDVQERQMIAEFPGHKFGINCVVSGTYTTCESKEMYWHLVSHSLSQSPWNFLSRFNRNHFRPIHLYLSFYLSNRRPTISSPASKRMSWPQKFHPWQFSHLEKNSYRQRQMFNFRLSTFSVIL